MRGVVGPRAADVIRRFRRLVTEGQPPSLDELARALDELALVVHDTPEGEPVDSEAEPPGGDYDALYARLSARFPDLGHYPVADPASAPGEQGALVGDAIDDLADIAGELEELSWRFDHLGPSDACWHLHFTYRAHWGRHLRDLSSYLHAKRFG